MWAYIDESGNTGNRLFDTAQPDFITAALMTKSNFDLVWGPKVAAIAKKVDATVLHAGELGVARLDQIAIELVEMLKKADARFYISRVEKRYIAATKFFDTYFDAGENKAVPWHVYWTRPLRLTMVFKLAAYVVTKEIAETVWNCLTAGSEVTSKKFFLAGAAAALDQVVNIPDPRAREIASEALTWALKHPDEFTTFMPAKINRFSHAPNFVGFKSLLDGLEDLSKKWNRPVREIVHDQQSQFEKTFKLWHELLSKPTLEDQQPVYWPGEDEPIRFGRVAGSRFRISTDDNSPGLQVVDVVIWLFKRLKEGKDIGHNSRWMLDRLLRNAYYNDFSFEGINAQLAPRIVDMMTSEIPEDQAERGRELLDRFELSRRKALREHVDNEER